MAEGGETLSNIFAKHREDLRMNMISRLAKTDAHFKHQQRGEPDLSHEEKCNIALDLLKKSPGLFLERFSKFLIKEDIAFFKDEKGDYRVNFYLEEIMKRCADTNHNAVKNRRYRALQELMDGGDYFSEDEMKWRDPLLFEQMIGQYKTEPEKEEEVKQEIDTTDLRFSTILLKHMDTQATKQFYEVLKEREECQEEEEEEDSEEEEEEDEDDDSMENETSSKHGNKKPGKSTGSSDQDMDRGEEEVNELERQYLRTEFLRIMQERFLAGEDTNFDYSKVDHNTEYDSLDIVAHDAEEKYFDADEAMSRMSDGEEEEEGRTRKGEVDHCDRLIRRRMEGIGLRTEEEVYREVEERHSMNMRGGDEMDVDDYMKYVPSDDLLQQVNGTGGESSLDE